MTAVNLLAEARAKGVSLSVSQDGQIDARWDVDPPSDFLDRLRANKPAILELLNVERIAGRPVLRIEERGGRRSPRRRIFVFENGGLDLTS